LALSDDCSEQFPSRTFDLNVPVEFHRQSFQINETLERLQSIENNFDVQEDSIELEKKLKKKLDEGNRIYHMTPLNEFYTSLKTDPANGLTNEVIISKNFEKRSSIQIYCPAILFFSPLMQYIC
jgi:hypothetical protein